MPHVLVFPCNSATLRSGPVSAALAVNSLGIAIGLPHRALVTLLALPPTDSRPKLLERHLQLLYKASQEESRVFLKAFYKKTVPFPVPEARDRAILWLFMCMERDWEMWRRTQKMGHKFKVTAMSNSCWLCTLQQQVYPGPRGFSQLCQWPTDLQDHLSGHKLHTAFPVLLPRSSAHTDNTGFVMD